MRVALVTFNVVPPALPPALSTLKYAALGKAGVELLRQYAHHHGYTLFCEPPAQTGLPPCWGKFPALLHALEHHDWAIWVDSDALVRQPAQDLASMLPGGCDLVTQDPAPWFRRTRLHPARGRVLQPVHTAVFAVRATGPARDLLQRAWRRAPPVAHPGQLWNGLGDQEALAEALAEHPACVTVRTVPALQLPPGDRSDALFTHYFGDRARRRYDPAACHVVVTTLASRAATLSPSQAALLHWCSIQCPDRSPADRGGPERFGYTGAALDDAMQRFDPRALLLD